jgi:hypothetical protein
MYRFRVFVADSSGCMPIFCQIFDAAIQLLGMSHQEFCILSQLNQTDAVYEATKLCPVQLHIYGRLDPKTNLWMPNIRTLQPLRPSIGFRPSIAKQSSSMSPPSPLATSSEAWNEVRSPQSPAYHTPTEGSSPQDHS